MTIWTKIQAYKYSLDAVVTVAEAAFMYGVAVKTVQMWLEKGKIVGRQSSYKGNILISRASLIAFRGQPKNNIDLWWMSMGDPFNRQDLITEIIEEEIAEGKQI